MDLDIDENTNVSQFNILFNQIQAVALRIPIICLCDWIFTINEIILTQKLKEVLNVNELFYSIIFNAILYSAFLLTTFLILILTTKQLLSLFKILYLFNLAFFNYKLMYSNTSTVPPPSASTASTPATPTPTATSTSTLLIFLFLNITSINLYDDTFNIQIRLGDLLKFIMIKFYLCSVYFLNVHHTSRRYFNTYILLYCCLLVKNLYENFDNIKHIFLFKIHAIKMLGFHYYFHTKWLNVNVPRLLRAYFLFKLVIYYFFSNQINATIGIDSYTYNDNVYLNEFCKLFIYLTQNIICIISLTSVISYLFYTLAILINKLFSLNDTDLYDISEISTMLFLILSVQSNITNIMPYTHRLFKLFRNFLLLCIAVLHYFHRSFDKTLMQLSVSTLKFTHYKHLSIFIATLVMFLMLPGVILAELWMNVDKSTWLFAATCFNLELIIKTLVTLVIYALFLYDSNKMKNANTTSTTDVWYNFDDYIYYIKSFGRICEFIFAILLFVNSTFILIFESYGIVRAIMMCLHAYFHIYLQASKGWKEFIKRHTAVKKIKQLPIYDAVSADDERNNELCVICYYEVKNAESRITFCKHIFHSICLRKWLYIQDTCPLCHSIVHRPKQTQPEQQQLIEEHQHQQ